MFVFFGGWGCVGGWWLVSECFKFTMVVGWVYQHQLFFSQVREIETKRATRNRSENQVLK